MIKLKYPLDMLSALCMRISHSLRRSVYSGCCMRAAFSLCHLVMRTGRRRWVTLCGYVVIPSNCSISQAWPGELGAEGGSGFGMHRFGYFVPGGTLSFVGSPLGGHHWVLSKRCCRGCP